jgi:hypothetical protein
MDDLVRTILESPGAWGGKGDVERMQPPDLRIDVTARLFALLVERAGGRVAFDSSEIASVPTRLLLIPYATEERGIELEVRPLSRDQAS